MFKIQTMNSISPFGIERLEKRGCTVGKNVDEPDGLLIRSANIHDYKFNENLLAIARAGSGYNNIPVEDCAEKGIVVFNTPGANAQAVKEQEICSMVMASRDVVGAIEWVKSISDRGGEIPKLVERASPILPVQSFSASLSALSVSGLSARWSQTSPLNSA